MGNIRTIEIATHKLIQMILNPNLTKDQAKVAKKYADALEAYCRRRDYTDYAAMATGFSLILLYRQYFDKEAYRVSYRTN